MEDVSLEGKRARSTMLTYESRVGGKCKHGENETSSEDSEPKKKGKSYCCTFHTQFFGQNFETVKLCFQFTRQCLR